MQERARDVVDKESRELIEVLSIVNAAQFFLVLVRGFFRLCTRMLVLLTHFCFAVLQKLWLIPLVLLRVVWWVVRSAGYGVERMAYGIAFAIAWLITTCLWTCLVVCKALLVGTWKTTVLVVYRIPLALFQILCQIVSSCVEAYTYVADRAVAHTRAIPHIVYHSARDMRRSFAPPVGWMKQMSVFIAIAMLFTLPLPVLRSYQFLNDVRADTESQSIQALELLEQGKDALASNDFNHATDLFAKARDQFEQAEHTLHSVPFGVIDAAKWLPLAGKKLSDGDRLILIGSNVARGGLRITDMIRSLSTDTTDPAQIMTGLPDILGQGFEAFQYFQDADTLAGQIDDSSIPSRYAQQFRSMKSQLHTVVSAASHIRPARDDLLRMIGADTKRRYMLVFQNNTELRPTGGFIGSYALVDVLRGKLVNVEIPGGGSYDLKGSLTQHVQSPMPLHLINPVWQFQDSNWFPDFPTSAQKMIWFYEKSGGPTVDGVIAINAGFFEKLLDVIGSIDMTSYGKTLTAKNFMLETQKAVELEYDKQQNRPKAFIADLFPKTIEKIGALSSEQKSHMLNALLSAFSFHDIQLYMRNEHEEEVLRSFGVAGQMRDAPVDYFSLVQANVGGGKGEGVIDEQVERKTVFRNDGRIEVHITIHRKHNGKIGDPFGGTRNSSYVRMYFPKGTVAVSSSGFTPPDPALFQQAPEGYLPDVTLQNIEGVPTLDPASGMIHTEEYGKSVFAQWIVLEPQQEITAMGTFLLPFTVNDIKKDAHGDRFYTVLIQRQSGSPTRSFSATFESEGAVRFLDSTPDDPQMNTTSWAHSYDPFEKDEVLGLTLQR